MARYKVYSRIIGLTIKSIWLLIKIVIFLFLALSLFGAAVGLAEKYESYRTGIFVRPNLLDGTGDVTIVRDLDPRGFYESMSDWTGVNLLFLIVLLSLTLPLAWHLLNLARRLFAERREPTEE